MKSKWVFFSFVIIMAPAMFTLTGCGKDKTLDDWKNEKVQEDLAKIQAVSGTYRGTLYSSADKTAIGPMSIDLKAITQVSGDQSGVTQQHATLRGKISLGGAQPSQLSFTDGYYDSTNNAFQIEIPFVLKNGAKANVDFYGSFSADGQSISNGTLEITNYPDNGAYFSAVKNSVVPASSSAAGSRGRSNSDLGGSVDYSGQVALKAGSTSQISMSLTHQLDTAEFDFINQFLPIKFVDVNLAFDDKVNMLFTNVEFDQRGKGTLYGVSSGSLDATTKYEVLLKCTASAKGWDCLYRANGGAISYNFTVTPTDQTTGARL